MLKKLSKAYSLSELYLTSFGKESYKRKIPTVCMVWNMEAQTFHEMTYTEYLKDESYRIVAIEIMDNKHIFYGVML